MRGTTRRGRLPALPRYRQLRRAITARLASHPTFVGSFDDSDSVSGLRSLATSDPNRRTWAGRASVPMISSTCRTMHTRRSAALTPFSGPIGNFLKPLDGVPMRRSDHGCLLVGTSTEQPQPFFTYPRCGWHSHSARMRAEVVEGEDLHLTSRSIKGISTPFRLALRLCISE
ncbi:hypothetical protein VTK56DRAFT_5452 [Thermocarpiscus australiensis]